MSDNVFVALTVLLGVTIFHLLGGTGVIDVLGEFFGHSGGDKVAMNIVKVVSYLLAIHGYFLFSAPALFIQRAINRKQRQEGIRRLRRNTAVDGREGTREQTEEYSYLGWFFTWTHPDLVLMSFSSYLS